MKDKIYVTISVVTGLIGVVMFLGTLTYFLYETVHPVLGWSAVGYLMMIIGKSMLDAYDRKQNKD